MKETAYSKKLKDPRWQKKRLEIMQRDRFSCQSCGDTESMLAIHHRWYDKGREPWDYPDNALVTLCESCHLDERELRPGEEETLLRVLRECGFLSVDLNALLTAIHYTHRSSPWPKTIQPTTMEWASPSGWPTLIAWVINRKSSTGEDGGWIWEEYDRVAKGQAVK